MTTASSSALGELIALAQAGGDLKTFKALSQSSTHTELNARLTRLGYKAEGRRCWREGCADSDAGRGASD